MVKSVVRGVVAAALVLLVTLPALPAGAAATTSTTGGTKAANNHLSPKLDKAATPTMRAFNVPSATATPARGPGSIRQDNAGRLGVDIRVADTSPATVDALAAAGALVEYVSDTYKTVTALVAPTALRAVGDVPGVQYVQEVLQPLLHGGVSLAAPAGPTTSAAACAPKISEGDSQLKAALARASFNVDGTGITVGILSDSFDKAAAAPRAAADVAAGELPGAGNPCGRATPVKIVDDSATGTLADEGRAMAQTVHDLAPGATLAFATAFVSETKFASNILALKDAGAKVIVDDVTYFDEPFYQDGPVANAVSTVRAAGVTFFSSAGNNNVVIGGQDVGSYEAPAYRPMACPVIAPLPSPALVDCHDFNPDPVATDADYEYSVPAGSQVTVDVQWAEPWNGVTTNLDVYLVNSVGAVLDSSKSNNPGLSQTPFELVSWSNSGAVAATVRLVIGRVSGAGTPRLKTIALQNGAPLASVEYPTSTGGDTVGPTIFGHNGAANAVSVAAIRYSNNTTPESFSSRGPVTILFNPVSGSTVATALATPQVLQKPDVTATDCAQNSFFGSFDSANNVWRFCGTSDAAPHAAAVAALLQQRLVSPTASTVINAMTTTATALTGGTIPSVGKGLLNANAAATPLATTTAVTTNVNPSVFGQSVTATATVTPAAGATTPAGTVTFFDGATSLGTANLNGSGVATLATSSLSAATHSLTAAYNGDATHFSSVPSPVLSQVVNKAATTTAAVSSPNPSTFGTSVTFTATVDATAPGAGTPTGNVTFTDGATTLGTSALNASRQATLTTSTLTAAAHSVVATYAGDTSFTTSAATAVAQTVSQAASTTTVASSPNPSAAGDAVTFTATITSPGPNPTGTVTFTDGGTSLGTGSVDGTGHAGLTTSALTVGHHSVTASYGGDTNHAASSSNGALDQVVQAAPVSLGASANPAVFGQPVTLTASVPGATGTVTFRDGTTVIGSPVTLDASTHQALLVVSDRSVGTHGLTATFDGNGSVSSVLNLVVNQAASATGLGSSLNPSTSGQSVTFTATVTAATPGAGTPTGTVTFKDGTTTIGSPVAVDGTGHAALTTSSLPLGHRAITAVFSGDGNFTGTASPALDQLVKVTGVSITTAASPTAFGQPATFTATVPGATGTVVFKDGGATIGSSALNPSTHQATFSTAGLGVGGHGVTATYADDGTVSSAVNQTVNKAGSTTGLSVAPAAPRSNQPVSVTVGVSPVAPGGGTPSGSVTVFVDGSPRGTAGLSGGQATVNVGTLRPGTHSVSASYSGSPSFNASASPASSIGVSRPDGYVTVSADGGVTSFGDATPIPSLGSPPAAPIVAAASTPSRNGAWLTGADGGIFALGDAQFFGSLGGQHLNRPIVGIAPTPSGNGYWLVASDGGIFAFGDAQFFGSTGGIRLNQPIVGMSPTPSGNGYWLVASDGGIFAYGDAAFFGSTGSIRLNKQIVGMATLPDGNGYWLVASDGGIFAFGVPFFGSTGSLALVSPIVAMTPTGDGNGYWMVAGDGGVFSFGNAAFKGSTAGARRAPTIALLPA